MSWNRARVVVSESVAVVVALLVFLMLMPARVSAQFEGMVESKNMTTDEMGAPQHFSMTMWIKKDMVKIRTTGVGGQPGSVMIYRNDRKKIWMINEDEKTYFEVQQDAASPDVYRKPPTSGGDTFTVRKTGKKKDVAGYLCEEILLKRDEQETQIWGTTKLSGLLKATQSAFGPEQAEIGDAWSDELARMGMYPLSAITRIGKIVVESQEVSKIETKEIPTRVFDIPSGYRLQKVGNMFEEGRR